MREVFYSYLERFSYFTYKISLPLANTNGERSSGLMIMTYACVQPPPALRKNLRGVDVCTQAKWLMLFVCLFVCFFSRLTVNPDLRLGDVTTTNWTMTEVKVLRTAKMYPKCDLFWSISALFINSRGWYLKVFIIVEFEFEVKNIDFLSKRCENRHLNISLKIIYFQFSPFPFFINRPLLPY